MTITLRVKAYMQQSVVNIIIYMIIRLTSSRVKTSELGWHILEMSWEKATRNWQAGRRSTITFISYKQTGNNKQVNKAHQQQQLQIAQVNRINSATAQCKVHLLKLVAILKSVLYLEIYIANFLRANYHNNLLPITCLEILARNGQDIGQIPNKNVLNSADSRTAASSRQSGLDFSWNHLQQNKVLTRKLRALDSMQMDVNIQQIIPQEIYPRIARCHLYLFSIDSIFIR